jgi:hypothetical protein
MRPRAPALLPRFQKAAAMSDEPDTTEAPATPDEAGAAPTEGRGAAPVSKGRRWSARGLILLAVLIGTMSIFATWAREQLLNTDQWVKTSTELLENPQISDELASYLVDELYANVNVSQELSDRLPPELQPLAPAAAAAVRQGLDRIAKRALQNPKTQDLWANANRTAHEKFVDIILEQNTGAVTAEQGVVVLDLRSILVQIGQRVGVPDAALQKIPASAAEIEIFRSDELESAQNAAQLLKTGSWILTFLTLGLFIFAVWLARGERRTTMLLAGWGLVVAGVIVLLARGLAGQAIVESIATTASTQETATITWDIATSLLKTLGWQAAIIGIGVVVAAWLGGPSRPATAVRRMSAPALQQRPDLTGIGVALVLLAVIAWAPIPALRRPAFILLLIVLVAIGFVALRRQTQREFPDADGTGFDLSWLRDRGSAAAGGARRVASSAAARVSGSGTEEPESAPAPPAADPAEARIGQLERLAKLHDAGVLDDDELAAEKQRLLRA